MNLEEIKSLIIGPMATVGTPFDDDFEVDYGKFYNLTQWWVDQGLVKGRAVIKVAAAMGEGPQLRDEEWPALLRTAVQAADGKAAILCGLHYKDTIRQIEDAKKAQDMGAIGLQISPPVHNGPTRSDVLRFYEDVSNAIDIGIMVYNTMGMLGDLITPDDYRTMAGFDNVVAIKWAAPGYPYEAIFDLKDKVNIIDNTKDPTRNHRMGGRGFINWTSEIHPPHDLAVWDLMEEGKYEEARTLWFSVYDQLSEFYAKTGAISGGQARVKKGMMKVMGMDIGDSRPPSEPLSEAEIDELRHMLIGFGFPVPQREAVLV